MGNLGNRSAQGVLDPLNPKGVGFWTVKFDPKDLPADQFEVYHIALTGPGGYFFVYIDTAFYSTSPRGDVNEYDPKQAMPVRPGQTIYFYWNNAIATPRPEVWIYLRTPQILG
jgi:hypothetical protein